MSVGVKTNTAPAGSPELPPLKTHRFTVEQYDRLVKIGFLTPDDRLELLEGWIVDKMPQDLPHASVTDLSREALEAILPSDWRIRDQKPIALVDSRPEPDLAVVRGPLRRYLDRHPGPVDIAFLIEVADSTVEEDRERKGRIYARARIAVYWILNIPEGIVEVYTQPRAGRSPSYRRRQDHTRSDVIPVVIEGQEIARIPVRELLPG
jgi:Uma2 family endonuclease